jgi:hypothetical protein
MTVSLRGELLAGGRAGSAGIAADRVDNRRVKVEAPSPPDYMREISGTGRGALALFFTSHESSFKVPSDCHTMADHRELGWTAEHASHA